MSRESSVSETTPLRRPESQNIEDVSIPSSISQAQKAAPPSNGNPNQESVTPVYSNISTGAPAVAADTVATIRNPSRSNYNNTVEVHISPTSAAHPQAPPSQSSINNNNSDISLNKMDTNKRILCRIAMDVLILLCVGIPILCFYLWGKSYKRGFFCDDESLMHPFHDSTIRNWMLYIIGLVIPVLVIFTVEFLISMENARKSNGNGVPRRYIFGGYEIPDWLVECYKKIGVYGFGAAVGQLTTDIAKYSIGRLRPHFFAVCQPIMPGDTTCNDTINLGRYITDFECRGVGSTERQLKEVSLSFPSGHSSFTFYAMVYLALYLQSRMYWSGSKLLRHFLQFLFIMVAWYTALSRVSDYKHHWSDVLAGSLVGTVTAIIVANYVSDLFRSPLKRKQSFALPRTTQDIRSNGH